MEKNKQPILKPEQLPETFVEDTVEVVYDLEPAGGESDLVGGDDRFEIEPKVKKAILKDDTVLDSDLRPVVEGGDRLSMLEARVAVLEAREAIRQHRADVRAVIAQRQAED